MSVGMPTQDDPAVWARLCRVQARITTNRPTAELLLRLADRYEHEAKQQKGTVRPA
jgi:hypothetical protein